MKVVRISELKSNVGEKVTVRGWLYNYRSSGSLKFLQLRDGSGFVQAVLVQDEVEAEVWDKSEGISLECSLTVIGEVSEHPKKPGVFELQVRDMEIVGESPEFPIGKKEHGPDFLLSQRHLWVRSQSQWAVLRLRDRIMMAMHEYLHNEGFIKTDSPIFTPNACEGTTDLFAVDYFDQGEAYLSQSGQLYLEAMIASVGRCYDFGPVFRAEKSVTRRHLTEFWMMDAEAAFVEHDENMDIQEGLVKYVVAECLKHCEKEFEILERDVEPLKKIVEKPFERLTYTEAIKVLHENGSDIKHGEDLGNDDEGLLTKNSDVPVFIHKWPKEIKPFYMKIDPENPELALNSDLIATEGGGEIAGGSERAVDYEALREKIKEEGLNLEDFDWYLDARKYGSVPHSGFGFGLERMVRWISGVKHIRECIPFPRMVNRVRP
jgi:asparaginyl-tRNA synthetase